MIRKMGELRVVVAESRPDLVVLTETWTNDDINNDFLHIDGYQIVERRDRSDTERGRGGGIIVYSRGVYAWSEETETEFSQCISIRVKRKTNDLNIHVVYRSPNSQLVNDALLCEWVRTRKGKALLIGDFNYPGIDWRNGSSCARGRQFYEACEDAFLQQHVDGPTHIKGNTLDLVLTNHPGIVKTVEMNGRIGMSDHESMIIEVETDVVTWEKVDRKKAFNRADWDGMRRFVDVEWEEMLRGKGAELMWTIFREKINDGILPIFLK